MLEQPQLGSRYLCELVESSAEEAHYRIVLRSPDRQWQGSLRLRSEDAVLEPVDWQGDAPPEASQRALAAFLRALLRARQESPTAQWMLRLHRWRP